MKFAVKVTLEFDIEAPGLIEAKQIADGLTEDAAADTECMCEVTSTVTHKMELQYSE